MSRLDHDANVRPWVQAAAGPAPWCAGPRWTPATGELPADQYAGLLTERTRLVAVTAASNVIGTRPDVPAITEMARAAGALSYVDGVHATPHGPVDVRALGADFYATSAYKWSGPHIGAVIASPALLESLRPDKLVPSPDTVPERFELGTPPFADLAGVTAAVEHLAGLDDAATGSRRERIAASMAAAEQHEQRLFAVLLGGLDGDAARHDVRQGGQADGDRLLHRRRAHPAAGRRAPGQPPDQRVERAQLRVGAHRRARHQGRGQRGPGRPRALQRRVRRRAACSRPSPS